MGARVDQSLNDAGRTMSSRIGLALSYLDDEPRCGGGGGGVVEHRSPSSIGCGLVVPRVAVHSPLRRSIETAEIASAAFGSAWEEGHWSDPGTDESARRTRRELQLLRLSSLRSLDYGQSYTGRPAADVRDGMLSTYEAWSNGRLGIEMDSGGETGFEVLRRAAASLCSLVRIGTEVGGPVLAISHSSFLRVLLAMVMDMRLDEATRVLSQDNGCINVLDMDSSASGMRRVGRECKLLGGAQSRAPATFSLAVPKTNIVRINEIRHLL